MSYFKFNPGDIIDVLLNTYPPSSFELNGDQITGSVRLDKKFLDNNIETRQYQGFSQKRGGYIKISGPFTASIDLKSAISGSTNNDLYTVLSGVLYPFYKMYDSTYTPEYNGTLATTIRVIDIPSIFYDKEILTGSFTASDHDSSGDERVIYDNGRGGLYSGSLTGTLVGSIFYQEGIAALTKPDLNDFGSVSSDNFKWKVSLKGTHRIPVKIFQCRAKAGQLNASTNPTYYQSPTTGDYKGFKEIVQSDKDTYITTIGLYNKHFELIGLARLAQPTKKQIEQNIIFKLKIDW